MADFKGKLLLYESLMFLAVQLITLFTGFSMVGTLETTIIDGTPAIELVRQPPITEPLSIEPLVASVPFLIAFVIAVILIIVLLKFLKLPIVFSGLFAFIMFIGAQAVFSAALGDTPLIVGIITSPLLLMISTLLAIGVVAARYIKPNLITHNLAIFLGVAGVSAVLGVNLRPEVIIFLLVLLSIYDFIAVFKTRHMVTMFQDLLKRGMPLAIVVPESAAEFKAHVKEVSRKKLEEVSHKHEEKKVLMLGTGDLAFPALFAVSALAEHYATAGFLPAIAIVIGSIIGLVFNHYLLFVKKFRFIPALPFIAAFSIAAYLLAILPAFLI